MSSPRWVLPWALACFPCSQRRLGSPLEIKKRLQYHYSSWLLNIHGTHLKFNVITYKAFLANSEGPWPVLCTVQLRRSRQHFCFQSRSSMRNRVILLIDQYSWWYLGLSLEGTSMHMFSILRPEIINYMYNYMILSELSNVSGDLCRCPIQMNHSYQYDTDELLNVSMNCQVIYF